ncbi:hypothetical protein GYMLUDRAFT_752931 [Collybiopsis luxurians FD-317 M1]|uniref:Uncharacterized protein n=1 Tax=Collybiopsis luxurians FD-317 M1 TaxID=944289 RepID=A0A0D0B304_9AGAR|nr:hypothetical protein GYMLUDRAFT_752931 [Collybiopsis luxurians FD-317 M1]
MTQPSTCSRLVILQQPVGPRKNKGSQLIHEGLHRVSAPVESASIPTRLIAAFIKARSLSLFLYWLGLSALKLSSHQHFFFRSSTSFQRPAPVPTSTHTSSHLHGFHHMHDSGRSSEASPRASPALSTSKAGALEELNPYVYSCSSGTRGCMPAVGLVSLKQPKRAYSPFQHRRPVDKHTPSSLPPSMSPHSTAPSSLPTPPSSHSRPASSLTSPEASNRKPSPQPRPANPAPSTSRSRSTLIVDAPSRESWIEPSYLSRNSSERLSASLLSAESFSFSELGPSESGRSTKVPSSAGISGSTIYPSSSTITSVSTFEGPETGLISTKFSHRSRRRPAVAPSRSVVEGYVTLSEIRRGRDVDENGVVIGYLKGPPEAVTASETLDGAGTLVEDGKEFWMVYGPESPRASSTDSTLGGHETQETDDSTVYEIGGGTRRSLTPTSSRKSGFRDDWDSIIFAPSSTS